MRSVNSWLRPVLLFSLLVVIAAVLFLLLQYTSFVTIATAADTATASVAATLFTVTRSHEIDVLQNASYFFHILRVMWLASVRRTIISWRMRMMWWHWTRPSITASPMCTSHTSFTPTPHPPPWLWCLTSGRVDHGCVLCSWPAGTQLVGWVECLSDPHSDYLLCRFHNAALHVKHRVK